MDIEAVQDAARRATEMLRAGDGPVFLELQTYRYRSHSMYDPDRYRSKEEITQWRGRDPIGTYQDRVVDAGLVTEDDVAGLDATLPRRSTQRWRSPRPAHSSRSTN